MACTCYARAGVAVEGLGLSVPGLGLRVWVGGGGETVDPDSGSAPISLQGRAWEGLRGSDSGYGGCKP